MEIGEDGLRSYVQTYDRLQIDHMRALEASRDISVRGALRRLIWQIPVFWGRMALSGMEEVGFVIADPKEGLLQGTVAEIFENGEKLSRIREILK